MRFSTDQIVFSAIINQCKLRSAHKEHRLKILSVSFVILSKSSAVLIEYLTTSKYVIVYIHLSNCIKINAFLYAISKKLAKNSANAERHPEAELLLFENYSHLS